MALIPPFIKHSAVLGPPVAFLGLLPFVALLVALGLLQLPIIVVSVLLGFIQGHFFPMIVEHLYMWRWVGAIHLSVMRFFSHYWRGEPYHSRFLDFRVEVPGCCGTTVEGAGTAGELSAEGGVGEEVGKTKTVKQGEQQDEGCGVREEGAAGKEPGGKTENQSTAGQGGEPVEVPKIEEEYVREKEIDVGKDKRIQKGGPSAPIAGAVAEEATEPAPPSGARASQEPSSSTRTAVISSASRWVHVIPMFDDNYSYLVVQRRSGNCLHSAGARSGGRGAGEPVVRVKHLLRERTAQDRAADQRGYSPPRSPDSSGRDVADIYDAVVIDPSAGDKVERAIDAISLEYYGGNLVLDALLTTHKHWDHQVGQGGHPYSGRRSRRMIVTRRFFGHL